METEILLAFFDPITASIVVGSALYKGYKGAKAKKKGKRRAKNLKKKYNEASAEASAIASEDLISKGDVNVASNIANRDARVNMSNYLQQVRGGMIAGGLGNSSIGGIVGADQMAEMEGKIADSKQLALLDAGMKNKQYKDKYRMMAKDYKIQGKKEAVGLRTASESYGDSLVMSGINDVVGYGLADGFKKA